MAITASDWLIISDVAHEAAFRIDVPEPHRGRWMLSYLPTDRRLTRDEAVIGVELAEMILIGLFGPDGEFDDEIAALYARTLGLTLTDAMCLLALRGVRWERDAKRLNGSRPTPRAKTVSGRARCHTAARKEVSR